MTGSMSIGKIKPVGRIDYLGSNGKIGERFYSFNEEDFLKTVKNDNYYGVPMVINVYRDENGKTIPLDFLLSIDPPVQGFHILDYEGEFEYGKNTELIAA